MVISSDPWVHFLLRELKDLCKPVETDYLFPYGSSTFSSRVAHIMKALSIKKGMFTPGGLRAGGATFFVRLGMPLDILRLRGRWAAAKSLEHYVQEAAAYLAEANLDQNCRDTLQSLASCALAATEEMICQLHAMPAYARPLYFKPKATKPGRPTVAITSSMNLADSEEDTG